jgi:parallel beta-helix repeat protein
MSALSIQPTYPIFTDIDGQPLEDGFIWLGTANLDPQTNPITVYLDAALTIPVAQPIRTLAGYPASSGTPARLYVDSDYSIRVMNKNGSTVYSAQEALERYSGDLISFTGFKGQVGTLADLADDDGSDWIGFEPTGFGAVARSAQDKLRETVSVKDFGAVGDGVADDTVAIQSAINAATIIYFLPGTYLVSAQIILQNNTTLFGENATIKKSAQTGIPLIFADNKSNVCIKDLSFDGNYTLEPTAVPLIEFNSVTDSKLSGLKCKDMGGNAITIIPEITGAINISDSKNVSVQNCIVDNTWGINGIHAGGLLGNNVTIDGCTITRTRSDSPISVTSTPYCKVINNYIVDSPGSCISYNAPLGVVSNNQIIATSLLLVNAITIGHPTGLYDASFTVVTNNIISQGNNGAYGIVVQNADRNIIANNFVFGGALAGILTGGTSTTIEGNTTVENPIGIAVTSASTQSIISSNNVSRFSNVGISLSASAVVSNNRIVSTIGGAQAININALRSVITGNYINVLGVTVATSDGSPVDGNTLYRSNIINDALTSQTIVLDASSTSTLILNDNIVPGGLIYLQPLDANFASRNVHISAVSAGSATLTYLAGTASSCRVVYL